MNKRDDILLRLRHMLDYANEVMSFTTDKVRADLDTNLMLHRALSMSVGIIGEAASQIPREFHDTHPEISWRDIIGMRNHLFHVYHRIDPAVLWVTATEDVPELIPKLEAIIASMRS